MALTQLAPPYPVFTDKNGDPLDNGYLYFGEVDKNPETNPIQVYYDSRLTQPVAQPIRTSNGYVMRNGAPALIYAGSQFSVTVRDKNSDLVIYSPVGYGIDPGAIAGVVIVQDQIGDGVTTAFGMGASPATENATNVFIDGVYQSKAGYSISGTTLTFSEAPPLYSAIEIVSNETAIVGGTDAGLVTYNEGGAGAVTRTVQAKLQETVSVKDFGAVGDGVADDTAAFTSAETAAGVKAVYVPAGSYKITGSITSGSFFTVGAVTVVGGTVNVLDISKPTPPSAHHSLSVINAPQAALQRFNLTQKGTGSGNVIQGFASDPYTNELFTLHVSGTPDTCILNKFEADGARTQTSYRWNDTPLTTLGHQELDISWDKDGERWFWTGENERVTNQARYIMRFQIADGAGTELTVSNVQQFQVFTDAETTGGETGSATACISLDGRYLVTEYNGSDTTLVKVFKAATLMNGGAGDYSTQQVYSWTFDLDTAVYPLQSMACDGSYVYIFTGDIAKGPTLKVFVYTVTGEFVEEINDFTVGETEAQGDGAGTGYELEGAGWIWHGGQPMLACSIASGDEGVRTNRIWVLGAKVSVTSYGDGNKPAFISQGVNDLAAPDGEALRLGHYNGATDTFTEGAKINSFNQLEFTPVTGTWTASIFDAASGGNASSTTDTAQYSKIGNMVWVNLSLANISISGMTSGNNFYIRGHGFTPTQSAVFGTPVVNDFVLQAGDFNVVAEISTDGNITLKEIQDSATNTIANVSQINGADLRISGWFKV